LHAIKIWQTQNHFMGHAKKDWLLITIAFINFI